MPFAVAAWSEEEALAQFKLFRFAKHGGQPYCADCDNPGVIAYKCRPIYKCKLCGKQFSNTSGTPWAHRKVSYRLLMQMVARFARHKQGLVALTVAEDLGLNYKTVLVWLHKMRAEIMKWASTFELTGEVEVDGAEIGGFIRPKNVKKSKSDHRRMPYRDKHRTFYLVAARERGGGIRTWVARHEAHAVGSVMNVIGRGTTVFSDMAAHWGRVRTKFDLRQINHNQAFYTPDACTNQVETIWASMRYMASNHRHIAQNYLDLYVADVAWTVGKAKKAQHEILAEVMACMSAPGQSELTGYFQGRKRGCAVVAADGSVSRWKPDPNARPMRREDNGDMTVIPPRRNRSVGWQDDFEFKTADEFLATQKDVPNCPGVYALFARDGEALIQKAGFPDSSPSFNWTREGALHIYTGETYGLRDRIVEHLCGVAGASTFRETLMAIDWHAAAAAGLPIRPDRASAEASLSAWMRENIVVGYRKCGYVRDVEAAILAATASPLNIARAGGSPRIAHLKAIKKTFRSQVSDHWAPISVVRPAHRR